MQVDGSEEKVWILKADLLRHEEGVKSRTVYIAGNFDGKEFKPIMKRNRWIDFGSDFYAAQTIANLDNENIWIGWINNWKYANIIPQSGWRGIMSIPRKLKVKKYGDDYVLLQKPVALPEKMIKENIKIENTQINKQEFEIESAAQIYLKFEADRGIKIQLLSEAGEYTGIEYMAEEEKIVFDRMNSGVIDFSTEFCEKQKMRLTKINKKEIEIKIVIDKNTIEIFVNEGIDVMTNLIFPEKKINRLKLSAADGEVNFENITILTLEQ
jgi:sucrose-6-phosphate hydrolase SacC (GH32 family)